MKSCFEFFGHGRDMSFSFSIACAYFCAPQLRCIPCRGGQKRVSLLLIIVKGKGLKKITPHRWATKSFGIIFLFTLLCIIALCLSSKIYSFNSTKHQLHHFPLRAILTTAVGLDQTYSDPRGPFVQVSSSMSLPWLVLETTIPINIRKI